MTKQNIRELISYLDNPEIAPFEKWQKIVANQVFNDGEIEVGQMKTVIKLTPDEDKNSVLKLFFSAAVDKKNLPLIRAAMEEMELDVRLEKLRDYDTHLFSMALECDDVKALQYFTSLMINEGSERIFKKALARHKTKIAWQMAKPLINLGQVVAHNDYEIIDKAMFDLDAEVITDLVQTVGARTTLCQKVMGALNREVSSRTRQSIGESYPRGINQQDLRNIAKMVELGDGVVDIAESREKFLSNHQLKLLTFAGRFNDLGSANSLLNFSRPQDLENNCRRVALGYVASKNGADNEEFIEAIAVRVGDKSAFINGARYPLLNESTRQGKPKLCEYFIGFVDRNNQAVFDGLIDDSLRNITCFPILDFESINGHKKVLDFLLNQIANPDHRRDKLMKSFHDVQLRNNNAGVQIFLDAAANEDDRTLMINQLKNHPRYKRLGQVLDYDCAVNEGGRFISRMREFHQRLDKEFGHRFANHKSSRAKADHAVAALLDHDYELKPFANIAQSYADKSPLLAELPDELRNLVTQNLGTLPKIRDFNEGDMATVTKVFYQAFCKPQANSLVPKDSSSIFPAASRAALSSSNSHS